MRMLNFPSQYQPGETPYEIFKDRMGAIGSIVEGIKGIIENKYNKGFIDTYLGQVNKAISAQQATDIISMATSDPTDLYDEDKLTETAGQFVDTFNMMGKLAQKESMMGTLSQKGVSPTPKSEVMLPKGDKAQLLNAIMNMPEGQMDFAPVLKYMEEHRPKFMGSFSPMEQFALSQAMGQIEDPQEELVKGIKTASLLESYLEEPTKEKSWEETLAEANEFIKNNPDYEISAMNPKTGSLSITKKSVKPKIDWEKVSEQVEKFGLKLTGMNVNPTTGNVSYSFGGTGITWEETLAKANQFMKDNPDYEVTSTNPKTGSVTIEKKGTGTTGGKPPTYYVAENIEKGFMEKVENVQDFGNELKRLQGLGIDTKTFETTEYFAELMKKKYEEMMGYIQYALKEMKKWESLTEEERVKEKFTHDEHRNNYKMYWEKANNYDQQYFNVTGQRLLTGE